MLARPTRTPASLPDAAYHQNRADHWNPGTSSTTGATHRFWRRRAANPSDPGEGRLPPIRVRLRSRHGQRTRRRQRARVRLFFILRSSRSDGSLNGFRSLPLESLTLRSFAIGSFSRRSIAYLRVARDAVSVSSGERFPVFELRGGDTSRRPTRRSRVVSALQITYPGDREGPPRGACAGCQNCLWQLGFLRTPKIDLDASGTFDGRLRHVIYCGGGVEPEPRACFAPASPHF